MILLRNLHKTSRMATTEKSTTTEKRNQSIACYRRFSFVDGRPFEFCTIALFTYGAMSNEHKDDADNDESGSVLNQFILFGLLASPRANINCARAAYHIHDATRFPNQKFPIHTICKRKL